jgi:hypothetical protein
MNQVDKEKWRRLIPALIILAGGYAAYHWQSDAPPDPPAPVLAAAPVPPPTAATVKTAMPSVVDDRTVILDGDGNPIATGEDLADHCLPMPTRCRKVEPSDLARICAGHPQSPANVAWLCRDYAAVLR